jgi:hypothetical protein
MERRRLSGEHNGGVEASHWIVIRVGLAEWASLPLHHGSAPMVRCQKQVFLARSAHVPGSFTRFLFCYRRRAPAISLQT